MNGQEELRYNFYLALAEYGRFQVLNILNPCISSADCLLTTFDELNSWLQDQQELASADDGTTLGQRVTPGALVQQV